MIRYDLLAAPHPKFPLKRCRKLIPKDSAIAVLDDVFGPADKAIRFFAKAGYPVIVVHCHWSTAHQIVSLQKLKPKLPRYEKIAREFPHIQFYVSHSLEYSENSKEEVMKRVALVKELCPSCIPINCRYQGATLPGVLTEEHGLNADSEIVSLDGLNCYDVDIVKWLKRTEHAKQQGIWCYRFNMKEIPDEGEAVPPPLKRTAIPSAKYLKSVVRLTLPMGELKKPTFAPVVPFGERAIYKSHSEDSQGITLRRENKPAIILPYNGIIDIITYNGKRLASIKGSPFEPGLYIYRYDREYGYQLEQRAIKKSDCGFVWFKAGHRYFGPVNSAFRAGTFRDQ